MAWTWTAANWRKASTTGKFWRTSEFNGIETAVGRYNPRNTQEKRLADLKAIRDAISAGRAYKQEKKRDANFVSPRGGARPCPVEVSRAAEATPRWRWNRRHQFDSADGAASRNRPQRSRGAREALQADHGSRAHRDMLANPTQYNINYLNDHDKTCRICQPQ